MNCLHLWWKDFDSGLSFNQWWLIFCTPLDIICTILCNIWQQNSIIYIFKYATLGEATPQFWTKLNISKSAQPDKRFGRRSRKYIFKMADMSAILAVATLLFEPAKTKSAGLLLLTKLKPKTNGLGEVYYLYYRWSLQCPSYSNFWHQYVRKY